MKYRRVVGVDPGTLKAGVIVWSVELGFVVSAVHVEMDEVRSIIETQASYPGTLVAVEDIQRYAHSGAALEDAFATREMIGRVLEVCDQNDLPWVKIRRPEVGEILCGTTKAKKGDLRLACYEYFKPEIRAKTKDQYVGSKERPGPVYLCKGHKGHTWSALAVACAAYKQEEAR